MQLADNANDIVVSAEMALETELWHAAKDLTDLKEADEQRQENLDFAKKCMYEGNNYLTLAQLNEGEAANSYYSQAISMYCKGQCYAKMAQKDTKIVHE